MITIGLGMIPVAGLFQAIMFPVAWTLLVDPDSAYGQLNDPWPGLDLHDKSIREILDPMNESKQYIADGED